MSSAASSASQTPPFGRVSTAMITPFQPDGSLDLDASLGLIEDHFQPGLPATYNV